MATIGTDVFDREWDAIVVSDTARVDTIQGVADEYDLTTGTNGAVHGENTPAHRFRCRSDAVQKVIEWLDDTGRYAKLPYAR